MALSRLRQTLQHIIGIGGDGGSGASGQKLSISYGPLEPPLRELNIGQLLEEQVERFPDRDAIVVPWTGARLTFRELNERSKKVARGLIALGIKPGDRIALLSGNCEQFVELFFATGRIGSILVVLNPAYTPIECINTMRHAGCRLFFTTTYAGRQSMLPLLDDLVKSMGTSSTPLPELEKLILVRGDNPYGDKVIMFEDVANMGDFGQMKEVEKRTAATSHLEVTVFMYTSGTTGSPKAAELTHYGIINDGRFIGHRLQMTEKDVMCCPPPLHHGFGLMLALLSSVPYGASIVFPSQAFDADAAMDAIVKEKCTGLHGVPTMHVAILQSYKKKNPGPVHIRCGIAAGSPVAPSLMEELQKTFGFPGLTIIYGATETSGSCTMSTVDDKLEDKLSTVGKVLPHACMKVIDGEGKTVPCGGRGEILMSGYLIQKGYFRNPEGTAKAIKKDENGVRWFNSGDEGTIDDRGYVRITGRIKDIIIRGGENIYPFEIEQRLAQHPSISQASVVGLKDDHYGEVVAAYLEQRSGTERPGDEEVRDWVRQTLTRFKAPKHVFWLGTNGVPTAFPATTSGKIRKVELREIGNGLIGVK